MKDHKLALVTGAASGIGAAVAARLEALGHKVIRSDMAGSDIDADLSTLAGRAALAAAARRLAPDGLDLVVAVAGISHGPPGKVLAVNFFGARACLEALQPLLAARGGASAVAICSTAAIQQVDEALVQHAFSAEEDDTLALAAERASEHEYATSKLALALWLRKAATGTEWAGSGICLNAVSPGLTMTAMTRPLLADPQIAPFVLAATPRAVSKVAEADDLAEIVCAIGLLEGGYLVGQMIYADGGTEALSRPGNV